MQLSRRVEWLVSVVAILVPLFILIVYANDLLAYLFIFFFIIGLLLFTAFSIEKLFILLAFYVSSFEVRGYLVYFPGISVWYSWLIAYPLFGLLLLYWIIYLSRADERFLFNRMDKAVIVYLFIMFMAALHGFLRGHDRMLLLYDFMAIPYFIGYFVFLYSPMKKKIGVFCDFLLFFAVFVSLQFIYAVTKFRAGFFLTRIVSEHIHIAQFAVPYIMASLVYSTSRSRKIVLACLLPVIILGVILCQQRSLYASTGLTIILLLGLLIYRKRNFIRNHIAAVLRYTLAAVIFIGIGIAIAQSATGGKFITTISSRIFIFLNLGELTRDISWQIRWAEIDDALRDIDKHWLFGQGFGASFITRYRYMVAITVDQSYVYLIWKTGVVGLLSFLYMYFLFFRRGIGALFKKISNQDKIFILAAMLNAAGMMLVAMANVSIPKYRLLFVWAGLFGLTEAIARKYE